MDAIYATLVSALRERGADETTAHLATDRAISIWRVAAERWFQGEDSPFAAEVFDAARHLRRIAAGDRTGTEGPAADEPARYQE